MSRFFASLCLCAAATACSPAYADRVAAPKGHAQAVLAPAEPLYHLDLIDSQGRELVTYRHKGRYYVQGTLGQRYSIRVTNPTNRRVEAVLSVDGLDAIDGKSASFRTKRGYVVPPRGQLKVDGFRVSTASVATFRFSSVSKSYAGRSGKARNVGVIGLAIFTEKAAPSIILSARDEPVFDDRDARGVPTGSRTRNRATLGGSPGAEGRSASPPATKPKSLAPPTPNDRGSSGWDHAGKSESAQRSSASRVSRSLRKKDSSRCCGAKPKSRPGLGTEFGERRRSAVSWTRFQRASNTPTVVFSMHYNDASGLVALGIPVLGRSSLEEVATRETANPFPGAFAEPPR